MLHSLWKDHPRYLSLHAGATLSLQHCNDIYKSNKDWPVTQKKAMQCTKKKQIFLLLGFNVAACSQTRSFFNSQKRVLLFGLSKVTLSWRLKLKFPYYLTIIYYFIVNRLHLLYITTNLPPNLILSKTYRVQFPNMDLRYMHLNESVRFVKTR